jgi:diaminopropionate ammonia-lyase
VLELLEQLRSRHQPLPTHVFLQDGVGGLAAAVVGHLWEELGGSGLPIVVVVEPELADCLFQSARAGRPVIVSGALDTIMAGLACGEVSLLAWQILERGAEFFMTIPDSAAIEGMRLLASGAAGKSPIIAGESATAGLAGLLCVTDATRGNPALGREMRLQSDSHVLLFGTEGATDPESYRRLVCDVPSPPPVCRAFS